MRHLALSLLIATASIGTAFIGTSALAQEVGLTGGFSHSSASAKNAGVSEDGAIGYKVGASVRFPLVDNLNFKTGLLYAYRPFELKTGTTSADFKFAYLDIPALIEFKLNDTVGLFGGLVIGINVDDKVSGTSGTPTDMEDMIAHAQVGASFLFDDMYGFDLYAERGLGDIYAGAEDYTTFGANFVYWLY